MQPTDTGKPSSKNFLRSRIRSFLPAVKGIGVLMKEQPNGKIHLIAAVMVVITGFLLHLTQVEWVLIATAIAGVFIAEIINTALEYLCNLVMPQYHPLVGKIKDLGAAAVLVAALLAMVCAAVILFPKTLALFS